MELVCRCPWRELFREFTIAKGADFLRADRSIFRSIAMRFVLCLAALFAATTVQALPFWQRHPSDRPMMVPDPDVDGTMPEDYLPGLKEVVDAAGTESPQMISDAMNIAIANAQKLYNGVAPMLPNVVGWSQYGDQVSHVASDAAANTTNRGFQYDLKAQQPVFHWGQLKDRLNQTRITQQISQRLYATGYQAFIGGLRRQYLALISEKIAWRNTRFAFESRTRALKAVRDEAKAGASSPGYVQSLELDYDDAKLAADEQEQAYLFARRQLAREIGRKDLPDESIPIDVPEPRYSAPGAENLLSEVLRTEGRYLGDSQVSLLQIRSSALDYDYWRMNLMPMLQVQAELNQYDATNATSSSVSQTAITQENLYLRVDWNIFDGFGTRGHKQEALLRRRQAERELKLKVEEDLDAAQNARRGVDFAWRGLQTTGVRAAIAHAQYLYQLQELKRGAGSDESVAAARANDYGSQYNLMTARTNFLATWADFVALTGHDPALNALPARYVRPVQ
jgi:outer membrane protein TolC